MELNENHPFADSSRLGSPYPCPDHALMVRYISYRTAAELHRRAAANGLPRGHQLVTLGKPGRWMKITARRVHRGWRELLVEIPVTDGEMKSYVWVGVAEADLPWLRRRARKRLP